MKVGDLVSYNDSFPTPLKDLGRTTGIVVNQHKSAIGVYWFRHKKVTAEHKNYLKVVNESR
jgi:hypothetical protein